MQPHAAACSASEGLFGRVKRRGMNLQREKKPSPPGTVAAAKAVQGLRAKCINHKVHYSKGERELGAGWGGGGGLGTHLSLATRLISIQLMYF